MSDYTYPRDLYEEVKKKWAYRLHPKVPIPPLPNRDIFNKLIEVVYHASFLTEERRRIWFRVIFTPAKTMKKRRIKDLSNDRIIKFHSPRLFNESELLKLAPSADPTQVMIGVWGEIKKDLKIWGLIETGTSWWDMGRHETNGAIAPPDALTLSSMKPDRLNVSRGGEPLLVLDQGKVLIPYSNVFFRGPIFEYLAKGAQQLYDETCRKIGRSKFDPEGFDDDYPEKAYIWFIQRILIRIRENFHGGTLIMIPDELNIDDTRVRDRITIKYPCHYDEAWTSLINELVKHKQYYDSYSKLKDKNELSNKEFWRYRLSASAYDEAKEDVRRAAKFLATLSAVDGAVVITDKLRLLGFGAEIIAMSPSLKEVHIISDSDNHGGEAHSLEFYGTRHRSAFRFCSSFEGSIAFIVSQDGGIRIVKRVGSKVLVWPTTNVGLFGF